MRTHNNGSRSDAPNLAAALTQRTGGSENLLLKSDLQQIRTEAEAGKTLVPGTGLEPEAFSGRELVSVRDEWEPAAEIPSAAEGPQCLVPGTGLEPARLLRHWILSPARLPIPPSRPMSLSAILPTD
jgi:hypothetical protein